MLFSIILQIIISLIVIISVHSLINYITEKFFTKKTTNLVNSQIQQYKRILETMEKNKTQEKIQKIELEKEIEIDKNELLEFANKCIEE